MKANLLIRSVIGLSLLFPSLSPAVDDLCQGLVQDTSSCPMQPVAQPAKRAAYVDPSFGTTIRRITQVAASGEDAISKPMYSTIQAFNADESLLLLWQRGRGHLLFDGQNYNFIRQLPIAPTDLEQVLWDPMNPDLLYYPTNYNAIPNLMVYRVSTNTVSVLRNFQGAPTNCPVDWGTLVSYALSTGERKVIIGPSTGYPYPPSGTHISALATGNPGWVAASIVGDPSGANALYQEIVLANTDTATVCRIGHHRSFAGEGAWGYWAEPHNVLSPSGTRVLFGSDWGNGSSVDTYAVELPGFAPHRTAPTVTRLFLIDKNTGAELREIRNGDVINLSPYIGRTLNIKSLVSTSNATMVYYHVNGKSMSIDYSIPYTISGDGNYVFPDPASFVLGENNVLPLALNDEYKVDGTGLQRSFTLRYE
jgi:hypothetical protein